MHKIGMTVIGLNRPAEYGDLLRVFESEAESGLGDSLRERERAAFGIDHCAVGARVFEMWKVPADLFIVVQDHDFAPADITARSDILRITALAGLLGRRLMNLAFRPNEAELLSGIPAHYGVGEDTMAVFDEEYYANLREHPFLQENAAG